MLEQQRDYVLRTVEERGVRLIRLWFTDVLGFLLSDHVEVGVSLRSRRLDSWIGSGRPIAIRAISGSSTAMATGVPPC